MVQWGFECDNSRAGTGLKERKLFKTNLDRDTAERHRKEGLDPHISVSEARKSTSDYFAKLYTHIEQLMKDQGQGWQDKAVEFVFTTPTTWTSQDTINEFRKAYEEAGFGRSNGKNHTVYRGLSEAEAVAVHTVVQGQVVCEKDDVILICDAGGGTTDLALVRVTEQTKSTATPTKTWPTVKA